MKSPGTRHGKARLCQLLLAGFVFLHVGAFVDVIDGGGQHLVIPMTDDTRDWRAAVLERVRAAHPSLVPFVASMRCMLNGKEVGAVCRPEDLEDATLRWRSLGLLGGALKAHNVDMREDVDTMKKDDLMRYARELGVETRQAGPNGKNKNWRAVGDVKKDCKAAQARLCQPSQENEPLEASAESSSSSSEAPLPAPERAKCGGWSRQQVCG